MGYKDPLWAVPDRPISTKIKSPLVYPLFTSRLGFCLPHGTGTRGALAGWPTDDGPEQL